MVPNRTNEMENKHEPRKDRFRGIVEAGFDSMPKNKVAKGNGIGIIYGEDGSVASELKWKDGLPN